MAATALAQEKVWFDKPSYDKAARLHFERLAKLGPLTKVVAEKILEQNIEPNPKSLIIVNPQDATNEQTINSSKKSKDKNNKAAKRHRNMKKSKSDAVEPTKEQITVQQVPSDSLISPQLSLSSEDRFNRLVEQAGVQQVAGTQQAAGGQQSACPIILSTGSLSNEISKARQHIKKSLQCMNGIAACTDVSLNDIVARVTALEKDNQELRSSVQDLKSIVKQLETTFVNNSWPSLQICPAKPADEPPAAKADEGDDDVDLFGSDSEGEDAEAARIREERVAAYAAKKSKKPVLIAKSNLILDVKPWDDETDMKVMEEEVRKIQCDGLLWGAAKLVPLAFGIHKLQISCVVEDEKVSVDWLTDTIQEIEDYVQSVDIAAFNKV